MATKHCALCEADFLYADCVEGGRADLARKILETLSEHPRLSLVTKADVSVVLRELFRVEGIDLTTKEERDIVESD